MREHNVDYNENELQVMKVKEENQIDSQIDGKHFTKPKGKGLDYEKPDAFHSSLEINSVSEEADLTKSNELRRIESAESPIGIKPKE